MNRMCSIRTVVVLITLLFMGSAKAGKLTLYRTVSDFQNNVGEVVEKVTFHNFKGEENSTLIFKSDDDTLQKREILCSEYWGFTYDSMFYRIVKPGKYWDGSKAHDFPVQLIYSGSIYYFENALSQLGYYVNGGEYELPDRYTAYMAATVEGDLVFVPGMNAPQWMSDQVTLFFKEHAQYASLEACVLNAKNKRRYWSDTVKICIRDFLGIPRDQR